MEYLSETAITSHAQNIRTQCRQTLSIFLGAHPQGKDIEKWMTFFINQLEYEYEDGRLSALEMVYTIFENFQPVSMAICCLSPHYDFRKPTTSTLSWRSSKSLFASQTIRALNAANMQLCASRKSSSLFRAALSTTSMPLRMTG